MKIPKVFILDVDGVLTTGQFLYNAEGKAIKVFKPIPFCTGIAAGTNIALNLWIIPKYGR